MKIEKSIAAARRLSHKSRELKSLQKSSCRAPTLAGRKRKAKLTVLPGDRKSIDRSMGRSYGQSMKGIQLWVVMVCDCLCHVRVFN